MSHMTFRSQSGSDLKLRTRLGPQYPHPTTPTFVILKLWFVSFQIFNGGCRSARIISAKAGLRKEYGDAG